MSAEADLGDGHRDPTLARDWGVPEVWRFAAVGSTNDVARVLAERGAAAGTTVVADEQRAGRGRAGRSWSSPPGLGVWLSVVLRPGHLRAPALLPLLTGLAAAGALDAWLPAPGVGIKWPNDLYAAGRKLGGILCEGSWEAGVPAYVIAGVGINVLHRASDFAGELRDTATSVRIVSGATPAPTSIAGRVASAVAARGASLPAALAGDAARQLAGRDVLAGRPVRVSDPAGRGSSVEGTAMGIAPDGALLVRDEDGVLRTVYAGTVRICEPRTALGASA